MFRVLKCTVEDPSFCLSILIPLGTHYWIWMKALHGRVIVEKVEKEDFKFNFLLCFVLS